MIFLHLVEAYAVVWIILFVLVLARAGKIFAALLLFWNIPAIALLINYLHYSKPMPSTRYRQ